MIRVIILQNKSESQFILVYLIQSIYRLHKYILDLE
jgi:hypothetical protein